MTRFKIAILILIVALILSIASLIFIQSTCSQLIDILDNVIVNIAQKNKEGAVFSLNQAIDYYEKIKPVLNIIVGQGETIEIRGDLNKAIFFVNMKDYQSAILHLEECKTDLNKIIVSNIPSISTVL